MKQNGRLNWLYSTISKALPTKFNIKDFVRKAEQPLASGNQPNGTGSPENSIINFENHDPVYFTKLVAYCSDQVSKNLKKHGFLTFRPIRRSIKALCWPEFE